MSLRTYISTSSTPGLSRRQPVSSVSWITVSTWISGPEDLRLSPLRGDNSSLFESPFEVPFRGSNVSVLFYKITGTHHCLISTNKTKGLVANCWSRSNAEVAGVKGAPFLDQPGSLLVSSPLTPVLGPWGPVPETKPNHKGFVSNTW